VRALLCDPLFWTRLGREVSVVSAPYFANATIRTATASSLSIALGSNCGDGRSPGHRISIRVPLFERDECPPRQVMPRRIILRHDGEMAPPQQFRLTKYDPAVRDGTGAYTADDWIMFSQIGDEFDGERLTLAKYLDVEARHLVVLASFIEESGTAELAAEGVENSGGAFRVAEAAKLSPIEAIEAVRQMLRDEGWCRLIDDDRFYIHIGWDYYVYVGTDRPCERSVALAESVGLFVDRDFTSPYLSDE
jgi:hypothetical protein